MRRWKENSIGLYTLVSREVSRFLRIWTQTLLPSIVSIALYFVIFGNLIGPRIGIMDGVKYIDYIVPGLIMMSVITNAYSNVVASFFSVKFQKNIEEMLVSPLPMTIILWGFVLGGVVRGMAVGILVTLLSLCFTQVHIAHLGITILVVVLTALLFSLAGLLNGIFANKFDDINIIPTFVLTPLTYLGGVFYSISMLSDFWQNISLVNPIFYMVNAFRYGMLGSADVGISVSLMMIIGLTLTMYIITVIVLKKGIGVRS